MIETSPQPGTTDSWEAEIRQREEEARVAFLHADIAALDQLWSSGFAVNSPLQRVLERAQVIEALKSGRIRHRAFEIEIETIRRHGEVVVVMGRDRVSDPPEGIVSHRRFTNIWVREGGAWRTLARHAQVASREPGGPGPAGNR